MYTGSKKGGQQSLVGSVRTRVRQDKRDRAAQIDPATTHQKVSQSYHYQKPSKNMETPGNAVMVSSFFILVKRRSVANNALGNI